MTTAYTSLLGLALPVQGELSGTWGDTVNNSITSLLDTSVAGTTNVSTDTDVTLTTTTGAANTARQAILLFSGARTALRTVTAPAQSKIYTVINATTGGFSVKLVGVGPTTGLTIPNGASAVVAWNGSDFVEVGSGSIGNLVVNGTLTVTGATTLQSTLAVTGNITNTAGTANGVAYLNGSKVVTSGSALTFDGTNFATTGDVLLNNARYYYGKSSAGSNVRLLGINSGDVLYLGIDSGPTSMQINASSTSTNIVFNASGSEQMRLTSTGLGIGTSSPSVKLEVAGAAKLTGTNLAIVPSTATSAAYTVNTNTGGNFFVGIDNSTGASFGAGAYGRVLYSSAAYPMAFFTNDLERMRIDSSGNLGIGTTGPITKLQVNSGSSYVAGFKSTVANGFIALQDSGTSGALTDGNVAIGAISNDLAFRSGGATRMRLNASGSLGLGYTPDTWYSTFNAVQFGGNGSSVFGRSENNTAAIASNVLVNAVGSTVYINSNYASYYQQLNSQHQWYIAPSGTAGNSISFTQAMTLDASGQLGIGTTSPQNKFVVSNSGAEGLEIVPAASGSPAVIAFNRGTASYIRLTLNGSEQVFQTSGTERARITSGGQALFGTPTENLSRWGRANFNYPSGTSGATIALQNGTARATGNKYGILFADNADESNAAVYVNQNGAGNNSADLLFGTNSGTGGAGLGNVTERMRITSTGDVGIGITPSYKLDVNGTTFLRSTTTIYSSTGGAVNSSILTFGSAALPAAASIYGKTDTATAGNLVFATAQSGTGTMTERARITGDGNVGIGTTSVGHKLHVYGSSMLLESNAANADFLIGDGTVRYYSLRAVSGGGSLQIRNHTGNSTIATFDSVSNVGIGTTSPTVRLEVSSAVTNGYTPMVRLTRPSATLNDQFLAFYNGVATDAQIGRLKNSDNLLFGFNSGVSYATAMTLDTSGNLALGVTPQNWYTGGPTKAMQIGANTAIISLFGTRSIFASNYYLASGTGTDTYIATGYASQYYQESGTHKFFTAPSGTAGNAITFTQAMTLDASGNLLVGATSQFGGADCKLQGKNGSSAQAVSFLWNATTTGDANFVAFGTEATVTQRGSITYNRAGGLTAYNTTSDYRAKDISGSVTDSGSVIDSVPVYMGKMKGATQERPMFIAHETPAYAHTGEKDAVDADGNPVYQQMDASALIPVMWAEIQSLRKRLADAGI